MSKRKKPRCLSVWLGPWTGEEYRCTLNAEHKGQHEHEGILWDDDQEWRKWA